MWETVQRSRERAVPWWEVLLVVLTAVMILLSLSVVAGGCGGPVAEAQKLEKAGDWDGALLVYEQVLTEDPDNVAALSGAAVALMVLQRFDEALQYQERVVAADPGDVQTRLELGFNYLNHQGRPEDAVRVFAEAVELAPTAKNLTFLAQALEQAGNALEAEGALRRAIEVDAKYAFAYSQLLRLLERQGRIVEAEVLKEQAARAGVTLDTQE